LNLEVSRGLWRRDGGCDRLSGHLSPAQREVVGHVRHDRAAQQDCRVVPAEAAPRRMGACVEAVSRERRQVDPTHEGHAPVDDDRLLVMAVHRTLLRVERTLDARVGDELLPHLAHVPARRPEQRQRRARPREHAHVRALRELGEERAQDDRLLPAHELELR